MSVAFDTIDHDIHLEKFVGLSINVLNWFKTYIKGRHFSVQLVEYVSEKHKSHYGVPQGNGLVPLLFSLYVISSDKTITS